MSKADSTIIKAGNDVKQLLELKNKRIDAQCQLIGSLCNYINKLETEEFQKLIFIKAGDNRTQQINNMINDSKKVIKKNREILNRACEEYSNLLAESMNSLDEKNK